ncbi:ribonuclease E [Humitalea rosea]|uniref:Ribonuclease E n=1 Tax=Humitalea rosea TaxID=990373 RepID=A0A2W7IQC3_9PROT|nr:ribonuclease E/G [Humitalea rosea]PZW48377.1 ribonuclease E [Humitalea rosea]
MTKRMLIDASHPEETRVVVLDGSRLDDFDIESSDRLPLKGNIYLAKVVRVEPSLQAAFVEYGGNRHGFLAFGEIHPDYYQIPVADRERLLKMQAAEAAEDAARDEMDAAHEAALASALEESLQAAAANGDTLAAEVLAEAGIPAAFEPYAAAEDAPEEDTPVEDAPIEAGPAEVAPVEAAAPDAAPVEAAPEPPVAEAPPPGEPPPGEPTPGAPPRAQPMSMNEEVRHGAPEDDTAEAAGAEARDTAPEATAAADEAEPQAQAEPNGEREPHRSSRRHESRDNNRPGPVEVDNGADDTPPPETMGGEDADEDDRGEDQARERRVPSRLLRHYKIQEVIRRRQIMLVQVVKEERGGKGAALTTYISLAGRYSVLMPNSPRGGGVSRKITSATDRRRLREIVEEVNLPDGMSLIVRTAGAARPKPEIKRDCEYLVQLWDHIRERTLSSAAPALIYEEADLLKRSVRDVYNRDFEEIVIAGNDAWKEARDFMRMLMPGQERKIHLHQDPLVPLFAKNGVEQILDAMMSPTVQLKSGGYLVINQTEALVAIDVNSGRATRDRHIEDTALRTNTEAAEEIARQVRLRDLAGLIVIDFIDMESARNDALVERKLKESLRHDRARIQVGRISHFGLLEMSRQRLRPSLTEHAFITCAHCQGLGIVRGQDSAALQVLRGIEEEGARRRASEIRVHLSASLAIHMLNRKRDRLTAIEARTGMCVLFEADPTALGAAFRIERTKAANPNAPLPVAPSSALRMDYTAATEPVEEAELEEEEIVEEAPEAEAGADAPRARDDSARRGRGRGRRRGGRREDGEAAEGAEPRPARDETPRPPREPRPARVEAEAGEAEASEAAATPAGDGTEPNAESDAAAAEEAQRRRRRRRGGRRRREEMEGRASGEPESEDGAEPGAEDVPAAAPPAPSAPVAPRYAGPTPADPFAGTLDDIFDVMAAAEAAAEAAVAAPARRAPRRAPDAPAPEVAAPEAAAPEAAAPEAPAPEAPVLEAPAPEAAPPVAPAEPVVEAAAEAVAPEPGEEPAQGPLVKPIVIGAEADAAAPRKKGWWNR